jgi:DNA-binding IclR family transcriptional regulator
MAGRKPKSPGDSPNPRGVQTIHRAVSLLRLVVKHNDRGIRLPELAAQTGLHHATARRMLKALEVEGLIAYEAASRAYHLGIGLYYFGAAAHQFHLRDRFRPTLEHIASETEDTVFLVIRSGNDALVIDRVEGSFPIRTLTHEVGQRVPLGIGAGSTTLLAALPDREMEAIILVNAGRYGRYNSRTAEDVRRQVMACRKKGYALSIGNMMPEAVAVGRPVVDEQGRAVAAISVAAISQRMKNPRREEIADLIAGEIQKTRSLIPPDAMKGQLREQPGSLTKEKGGEA